MKYVILCFLFTIPGAAYSENEKDLFSVLGLFKISWKAPVPDGYSEAVINELLPSKIWKEENLPYSEREKARAYLIDHGDRGKLITVDRWLSRKPNVRLAILYERPADIPLRHKIHIGTDKANWKILWRSGISPKDRPFHRAYLLQIIEGGPTTGIIFHEGVMITIDWQASINRTEVDSLTRVTQKVAERAKDIYADKMLPISAKLEDGSPVIDRPDLPDPDKRKW